MYNIKRYNNYLNENIISIQSIYDLLKRDCSRFLNGIKLGNNLLYRGDVYKFDDLLRKKVNTNRNPSSISVSISKRFDYYFNEMFGLKPRSEGVFSTGDQIQAEIYGEIFLFFPIGNYEFLYNPYIDDLFTYLSTDSDGSIISDEYGNLSKKDSLKVDSVISRIVSGYRYDNLNLAIRSDSEITFFCEEYYLVKNSYEKELKKLIFFGN